MKKEKYTTPSVAYADIVLPQMIATSKVSEQVFSDDEHIMDGSDALVKADSWQDIW